MSTRLNLRRLNALFGDELPQEALTIMRASKTVAAMWTDLEALADRINAPTTLRGYLVAFSNSNGETVNAFVSAQPENIKLAAETIGEHWPATPLYVRAGEHATPLRELIGRVDNGSQD